ncbi:conserved hypothetical protein [Culex quinquefasciatus]|uniref:Uncharacterized protein n=1 Tax=Culex quinquefasciatus TaxID=7176 RepID=B0W4U2_CULQU|nr:conserved hypothetical protein [Culex quinquefasciatus]|eukprot:XP_001843726.1 conserved hypothetical protein [Culex quinquefasciatus]
MTMNGSVQFTGDFESPTRLRLYSKKLERGEWVPGFLNREVLNMCPLLQLPHEIWYPFTSIMKQKSCPYRAGLLVYSKKLERGEWVSGFFNRVVQNVCPLLQMPTELWYPYTRLLKQKTCPYKAGHVENGKPSNIGNFADYLHLPPSFIGDWRMYYEITTTRNGRRVPECLMMAMTVSEV